MQATPVDTSAPKVPDPFTLVVFGASGDLTRRKLLPAIYQLWCQGLLGGTSQIIGFARSDETDESFRGKLRDSTREFLTCCGKPADDDAWRRFESRIFYHRGAYDNTDDFVALNKRMEKFDPGGNRLYYLATPPATFEPIVEQLDRAGMARKFQNSPWTRIVIEKPFGRDLQTAHQLNERVRSVFDERQIFRIDHYLGKETVQNIMVLRFANSIFEHLWSKTYIDHVQITVAESLSVGGRGGYYDTAGALRDMVQNHMMHLLCLVAMAQPATLDAESIRNEKVKVLSALQHIPRQCALNGVVRAQYTAGCVDGEEIPGYRQTAGVSAESNTETFVAFKTFVDNERWSGVPFYLRTGKCLPRRCTEISVHFKDVSKVLFNRQAATPPLPNVLAMRVQPNEGISLEFQVKVPGPAMNIKPLKMDFGYAESFGTTIPDAYERLLLDAALGDATLFTRADELEAAWRFLTPVIEGCSGTSKPAEYPAGSWGPPAADDLIEADGRKWYLR